MQGQYNHGMYDQEFITLDMLRPVGVQALAMFIPFHPVNKTVSNQS